MIKGYLGPTIETFKKVLSLDKNNVGALQNLAELSKEEGNFQRAIKIYKNILELDRKNISAHINMAMIYDLQGYTEEAFEERLSALELDPYNTKILLSLANYSLEQEDFDSALNMQEEFSIPVLLTWKPII
jgi:tetratricopeptide (TPR) repeat protein